MGGKRHTMKMISTVVGILFMQQLSFAQQGRDSITVSLSEVNVKASAQRGISYQRFDSARLAESKNINLQQFLQENSTIQLKSYGTSGSSLMSIRGANAGHSKITWNGMALTSPMLNVTDLSILQMSNIDELSIVRAGSSAAEGNGALAGIVALKTNTPQSNSVQFSTQANTLQNFNNQLQINLQNGKWSSASSVFWVANNNKFQYANRAEFGSPIQDQINSETQQVGFTQQFGLRQGINQWRLLTWYQESDRDLSPAMFNRNTAHYQMDKSWRNLLQFERVLERRNFETQIAYTREQLRYVHRYYNGGEPQVVFNTNSYFDAVQFQGNYTETRSNWDHILKLNYNFEGADVPEYGSYQQRQRFSVASILNGRFGQYANAQFANRYEYSGSENLWAHSLSLGHKGFVPGLEMEIAISKNYSIPGLNDLYWVPGGNPNLKSEKSYEIDYRVKHHFQRKNFKHNVQLNAYYAIVNDWILWKPSNFDNAIWTAQNIAKVQLSGFEWEQDAMLQINAFHSITANFSYAYNQAIDLVGDGLSDQSKGKQLIYVPLEKYAAQFKYGFRKSSLTFKMHHVSHRYTSTDNLLFLPSYQLFDLRLSHKLAVNKQQFNLSIYCDNLLDTSYESIPFQAMPARVIGLSISYMNPLGKILK